MFRLYSKDEISPTPSFSCFFLISGIQDVYFQNLFYFILATLAHFNHGSCGFYLLDASLASSCIESVGFIKFVKIILDAT